MLSDFIQNQGANFPTQEEAQGPNVGGDPCLFLTSDPKPRLRWSAELHNRFVDAVTQLGGPGKATPKSIMRTMGVKGLTLYHLKSHLQKYRIGKQSGGESIEQLKDVPSLQGTQGPSNSAPPVPIPDVNEGHEVEEALRAQMEVQRKLHEQLEVQKCLERFIDAESRYVQSLLERACQLVAKASTLSTSPGNWGQGVSELDVKEVLNFPCHLPSSPSVHQLPMERVGVHSPKEPPNQRQDLTTCFTQGSSTSQQNPVRLSVEGFQTQSRKRMRSSEYGPESLIWEMARTRKTYINMDHTDCHGDLNFLNVIDSDERAELEGNNKAVTMEYLSPDAGLRSNIF